MYLYTMQTKNKNNKEPVGDSALYLSVYICYFCIYIGFYTVIRFHTWKIVQLCSWICLCSNWTFLFCLKSRYVLIYNKKFRCTGVLKGYCFYFFVYCIAVGWIENVEINYSWNFSCSLYFNSIHFAQNIPSVYLFLCYVFLISIIVK